DVFLKAVSVGPHRDDLEFLINGESARKFGSQGQQRTTALSLKLAEIELVKNKIGDNPVLLLDDVLSELDRDRQTMLLDSIRDTQTMISCTGLEEFVENRLSCDRIYHVENGSISRAEKI
ncbi:MAG: DNA replication and repair protein RecF, partial [Lachnospiraceae bacterium]|nr:DNA replication and repair protein RecF [Lachnospiraceae bacterium]